MNQLFNCHLGLNLHKPFFVFNCAIILMWASHSPSRGSAWWIWLFSSELAFLLAQNNWYQNLNLRVVFLLCIFKWNHWKHLKKLSVQLFQEEIQSRVLVEKQEKQGRWGKWQAAKGKGDFQRCQGLGWTSPADFWTIFKDGKHHVCHVMRNCTCCCKCTSNGWCRYCFGSLMLWKWSNPLCAAELVVVF